MTGKVILTAVILLMTPTGSQMIHNREKWFQEAPFWSAMLCSVENSRALAIYEIYTDRSYRLIEFSSAFVSRVYEDCDKTILLKRYYVPGNEEIQINPQWMPRNVLQENLEPDNKNFQPKVKLLGRASTTTVILLENKESFNEVFLEKEIMRDWNSEGYFVVLMISDRADDLERLTTASEMILKRLWKEHQILDAFFAAPFSTFGNRVFAYNPFLGVEEDKNSSRRGQIEIFEMRSRNDAFGVASKLFTRDTMNLRGYILNVGIFEKVPTAIKLKKGIQKQYAENSSCECSKGYGGSDGIMLGTLARIMNFTVNIVEPSNGLEFGYQMENGTYVGTLGDVVSGKIDVSFNGMFMKVYGKDTNAVEFSTPVGFDRICIVVPKARKKPQWLKIFKCFDLTVWLYLAIMQIICGTIWYMLKKNRGQTNVDYRIVLLDTVLLFVNSPQKMPRKLTEKIFIGSFLLLSVIMIGTFQGSLYQSFTTDSYYKDIDTLKDLEKSGLPIGTTSPNLHNVFGIEDDESQTMINLRKRMKILTPTGMYAIERAAYLRNMAAVRSENDLEITIRIKYVDKNGNMLLHAVGECPQAYFLSYIGPKKSIFLRRINVLITRAMEGGLPRFWLTSTIDNLISVHRVAEHRGPRAPKKLVVFTLDDVQTSFYILIVGYLLSILVFLWESASILVSVTRSYDGTRKRDISKYSDDVSPEQKLSRTLSLDRGIMASFWLLTLGILFGIFIEILNVSAWDPRIRRYEGYDLGRGPVFYEAYYRDEQTGNDNPENNLYPEKRYFDHETVVERSYQVPADPYGPVSDRTGRLIAENYNAQGSIYLPTSIGNNEQTDKIANAPQGYSHVYPQPVREYMYETRPKIYVPEDRFIFGEPTMNDPRDPGPYNVRPTKFNPDTEQTRRNPSNQNTVTGTNVEDPRLQTNGPRTIRSGPETGSLLERIPEPREPAVPLENIYEPRPQVINYVFSMPKKRYQPVAPAGNEPAESRLEAEVNEWPRNYGDNLINDDIRREDEKELRKDEVAGVESIEVSQVPRHKIRHHHGEWPKRNYSRPH